MAFLAFLIRLWGVDTSTKLTKKWRRARRENLGTWTHRWYIGAHTHTHSNWNVPDIGETVLNRPLRASFTLGVLSAATVTETVQDRQPGEQRTIKREKEGEDVPHLIEDRDMAKTFIPRLSISWPFHETKGAAVCSRIVLAKLPGSFRTSKQTNLWLYVRIL